MKILSIETSCDDTAVALVEGSGTGARARVSVLAEAAASQIPIHRRYGGVVPEIAARAHAETIIPTIDEVFEQAGLKPLKKWSAKKPPVDAIAVTCGPGLITSLWVGVLAAKTLAAEWGVPIFGVNHLVGHIYAQLINRSLPKFPLMALIVSGGHTELIWLKNPAHWKKIGATRDDAAGEAFDKFAKVLGLPYPGGPEISRAALKGNPAAINFPRPMLNDPSFDFSFAGLKTAGRNWVEAQAKITPIQRADACASYQQAIVDVLIHKTQRALKKFQPQTLVLGGGVAANNALRAAFAACADKTVEVIIPDKKFTTDNAAMIGAAAWFAPARFKTTWRVLAADPNYEIQ